MRIPLIFTLILASLSAGCSSQKIKLAASPGQESIVRDGVPALVSKKRNLVMLKPNTQVLKGNARPAFTVAVRNHGTQPITLLETNITAIQSGDRTEPLKVHRYAELVSEEETRQAVAAFGAALAGAGRAMSASQAGYVHTTGNVNAYGTYGSSYGTYSATTYDPLRAQLAQQSANAQTANEFDQLRHEGEQNLSSLQQTILKDNTVLPGEWYGGYIVLDQPTKATQGPTNYSIRVEFDGEIHEFNISQEQS
jgi:hypothetical protein